MQNQDTAPIAAQKDNLLGICHAIGEDFGFNPIYLRIALAVLLLFSPEAMLIGYGTAALIVLASRLLVRTPKRNAETVEQPSLREIATQAPVVASHLLPERMAA